MRAISTTGHSARAGFTLIELLIVIGIIALLISMAVVVGARVVEGGKARATQDVLRTLEESLGAWSFNADSPLPADLEFTDSTGREYIYPLIDASLESATPVKFETSPWPSATFYAALVMQDASIQPILQGIDSSFVGPSQGPPADRGTGDVVNWAIPALELKDAWGRPMRLVHPAYHGGYGDFWDAERGRSVARDQLQGVRFSSGKGSVTNGEFRRSYRPEEGEIGDADEGMCVGGTPYFYSAGEDGNPGTRGDNVYSTVPRFPVETRDFE